MPKTPTDNSDEETQELENKSNVDFATQTRASSRNARINKSLHK